MCFLFILVFSSSLFGEVLLSSLLLSSDYLKTFTKISFNWLPQLPLIKFKKKNIGMGLIALGNKKKCDVANTA